MTILNVQKSLLHVGKLPLHLMTEMSSPNFHTNSLYM